MNTKNLISTMLFVFLFLLLSCEKKATDNNNNNEIENNNETGNNIKNEVNNNFDTVVIHDYRVKDVLYPQNAKLKQVSRISLAHSSEISYKTYLTNYEKFWYVNTEYEYDNFGKLSKILYPWVGIVVSYDIYNYNDKNQLEKITNYNEYHYVSKTHIYSYDNNGNKLKTLIEQWNQTDSILYFYEENRLVREDKYDNSGISHVGLKAYIQYEYDNQGNLVKETNYGLTDKNYSSLGTGYIPYQISMHTYRNDLNVKTRVGNLREIRRYYDENDNLIYFESEELSSYSSALSFISKYEYY